MRHLRALVIALAVVFILFAPIIPAYRINGPFFPGTITASGPIVGVGRGPCINQMLVSIVYLLTGLGPMVVLAVGQQCS